MKKKIYSSPLFEVASINMSTTVLTGSSTGDWSMSSNPGHPGAPARRRDVVQVF